MNFFRKMEGKIKKGLRISSAEAVALFRSNDILALGEMANHVREKIHGKKTCYVVNRHLDYSNYCVLKCNFCAFARKKGLPGGFEHTIEDLLKKAKDGQKKGISEVHIVGGLHPTYRWSFYTGLLRAIKKEMPNLHIKAFTAVEIRYFSKKFRMTEKEVLEKLLSAGLDSMPGGGAEIFAPKVRREICAPKGKASFWLDTHKLAHKMGLKSSATMLYGHVESIADRVDHMSRIRKLQDETGGFLSFVPLAFNPKGTKYESTGPTSAVDDLKTLAVARLYLDNIRHIKAYWIMSGVETSQIAQYFGANDLHGTVIEENISHMAGSTSPEELHRSQICSLVKNAGRIPVERDSLYREIL